jgi:CDP-glucose 4,6-dehydratase
MTSSPGTDLSSAFAGKRVLVTGHTGFKGAWLAFWLAELGAEVTGYALAPDTDRSLFADLRLWQLVESLEGDLRDRAGLQSIVRERRPHVLFHLAAQSLVRRSYREPVETFEVNVLGTVNLLEAARRAGAPCAIVAVTSDKCYENRETGVPFVESDPMGGSDPYSASKGAAEIGIAGFRRSFFSPARLAEHGIALASARAGNVLGFGDWAEDRIVPDAIRALSAGRPVPVRHPESVRPWQHVLEPLSGYLRLAAGLLDPARAPDLCEGWNFGPLAANARPVREVVEAVVRRWGSGRWERVEDPSAVGEAAVLSLSVDKAGRRLDWHPRWDLEETVARTVEGYALGAGAGASALRDLLRRQIARYLASPPAGVPG